MTTDSKHVGRGASHHDLAIAELATSIARRSDAAGDAAVGQLRALGFDTDDIQQLTTTIERVFVGARAGRTLAG